MPWVSVTARANSPDTTSDRRPAPPVTPRLSVIVPTRAGWPAYRASFLTHRAALEPIDEAELIVADGSEEPAPPAGEIGPRTRWLKFPGEPVPELRLRANAAATAPTVAQSEDHVVVPPDWGTAILRAHAEHPEAIAIGGCTRNGSPQTAVDWAAFLVGHGLFAPPLGVGTPAAVLGLVNVSYTQRALAWLRPVAGVGVNEVPAQRAMAAAGETLLVDDRISATHVQPLTFNQASSLFFHAGRMSAATRRTAMSAFEWLRLLITPVAPPLLTGRLTWQLARRSTLVGPLLRTLPLVALMYTCRTAGELVGYAAGPGRSAWHLH